MRSRLVSWRKVSRRSEEIDVLGELAEGKYSTVMWRILNRQKVSRESE